MSKKNKSILRKADIEFLYTYLNNTSPTGFESSGQKIWLNYLKPYIDEQHTDVYGTAYAVINPKADYRVVIEAHADEISWYVNYIEENGLIYVVRNGGSDHLIAPSKRVHIHTKKGIVAGIFGWPAIHTRIGSAKEETPNLKNICIDVGASNKKEVLDMGITPGCVITYQDGLMELNEKFYTGRALDNRIGGFMIAQVARLLHENKKKLPFALYIVNSVQEEVGLNGAKMIADTVKPHVAIVTDVCHDTSTPMMDKISNGDIKCGKGPAICHAPAVHNNLRELIIHTADKNNIPFQYDVASRYTGTDTDAFAYSNGGVASALISLALRYMHTTVETVSKQDVEDTILLIYHTLLQIKANHNFKYL